MLGFSFHDLMSRLKVDGPDDAWARLQELLAWFDETQAEGGYRRYYAKDPARGTMQGGNVPGGLGLDKEFFEGPRAASNALRLPWVHSDACRIHDPTAPAQKLALFDYHPDPPP